MRSVCEAVLSSPHATQLALSLAAALLIGCQSEDPREHPVDGSAEIAILIRGTAMRECEQAITSLKRMGPQVVPQIASALHNLPSDSDGSWLGEALFAFGEDAAPAGNAVLSRLFLGTNTAHVMASVLAVSGPKGQELLVRALSSSNEACLVAALVKVEPRTEEEFRALSRLLPHPSPKVREEALLRLSEGRDKCLPHSNAISVTLQDAVAEVRIASIDAVVGLSRAGNPDVSDGIGALLLGESDEEVAMHAIEAIRTLEARGPMVHRGLKHAAASGAESVKSAATAVLAELFPN